MNVGLHIALKKIVVLSLHFFGSKSTISRFGECFHDGQFLVCCSSTHGAPLCPAIL